MFAQQWYHKLIYEFLLIFLIRCNGKPSCTFDGRAGCVLGVCNGGAGFNNYFGNPCDDGTSKCLKIEYVCIAGKFNKYKLFM